MAKIKDLGISTKGAAKAILQCPLGSGNLALDMIGMGIKVRSKGI